MATYAELLCSFVSEVKLNHEDDIVDQVIEIRRFKFYKSMKCIYTIYCTIQKNLKLNQTGYLLECLDFLMDHRIF